MPFGSEAVGNKRSAGSSFAVSTFTCSRYECPEVGEKEKSTDMGGRRNGFSGQGQWQNIFYRPRMV